MSNTKNLAALAATLDDGSSGQVLTSTGSGGVAFADAGGSGVTTHTNQDAMVSADASSAYTEGSLHYDLNANKLFVKMADSAGSGFYQIAAITNATPTISSPSTGTSFTLDNTGSPTTISVTASDDDVGQTLNYYYTVSTGSIGSGTTVTTSSTSGGTYSSSGNAVPGSSNASTNSHFRITPSTSVATEFSLTFYVTDGTNIANTICSFSLAFSITDSHYTTLLMATNSTTAGNNSTITYDTGSSTGNSLTVNGDAHAGTFSPYRHGGYSTYFDGTTNTYLNVSSSAGGTAIGSGDFTISFWVYANDTTTANYLLDYRPINTSTGNYPHIRIHGDGTFKYNIGGTTVITGNTAISSKQWAYFCLARDNGTTKMYVNGTLQTATYSGTESLTNGTNRPVIGTGAYAISPMFDGYISDLRVVTSLDTSAYSVPTERMSAITNTQLLTCHLPYIADGSSNGHTITVNGNTLTAPIGPYDHAEYSASDNGGSVYFDGTDDALRLSDNSDNRLGTSPFTMEGWFYSTDTSGLRGVFSKRDTSSNYWRWLINGGAFNFRFESSSGSGSVNFNTVTVQPNTWYHFAVTRDSSNNFRQFVNGTLTQTISSSSADLDITGSTLRVGELAANSGPFKGYISDVKIVKNTVSYTSDFTPPTAPLSSSNASFYLSGTDAHIFDKAQAVNLELKGGAVNTSTQTKFSNTTSVYFDGTDDYILTNAFSEAPVFGSGDWTVEGWFYATDLSNFRTVINQSGSWELTLYSSKLRLVVDTDGSWNRDYVNLSPISDTLSLNTWYHFALVKNGNTVKGYTDGTEYYSNTSFTSTPYATPDKKVRIGYGQDSPRYWKGFLQDIRITKGLARYTSSFTPPSSPLKG